MWHFQSTRYLGLSINQLGIWDFAMPIAPSFALSCLGGYNDKHLSPTTSCNNSIKHSFRFPFLVCSQIASRTWSGSRCARWMGQPAVYASLWITTPSAHAPRPRPPPHPSPPRRPSRSCSTSSAGTASVAPSGVCDSLGPSVKLDRSAYLILIAHSLLFLPSF